MQILNGAVGALLTLALFAAAFVRSATALAVLGAVTSLPFCIYAAGYPLIGWTAWLALAGNVTAAICFIFHRRDMAFAALTPFMGILVFIAVIVLRGGRLLHR